jgi:chorismate mutase
MSESGPPPNDSAHETIRDEIEGLDRAMLALIAQRLNVADGLAAPPPRGPPIRPGSEIKLMRRLLAQAQGIEPELVIEVWRALVAASLRRQRVIDVAVGGARGDPSRLYDIARRHFGARTRIAHVGDPQTALARAVENPETCVAVTPWPAAPGVGSWWPALSESRFHKLHLIAGLPMAGPAGDLPEASIFSAGVTEEAGGDVSLLLVDDPHHRAQRALNELGLNGKEVARSEPRALIRIEGFLALDDPRAKGMAAMVDRVRVLGSYARV